MDARNTFENPDAVKPSSFTGFERKGGDIALALPAKSVVIMEIQ
jgi:alpha-N-arabinofuranosidase